MFEESLYILLYLDFGCGGILCIKLGNVISVLVGVSCGFFALLGLVFGLFVELDSSRVATVGLFLFCSVFVVFVRSAMRSATCFSRIGSRIFLGSFRSSRAVRCFAFLPHGWGSVR